MAMTITEKILAAHAGLKRVEPGELIEVDVDFCLANDITAPIAIERFRQAGAKEIFDALYFCEIFCQKYLRPGSL